MKQLFRYAIVGFASNTVAYVAYLFLTWLYLGPKLAMSGIYFVGAVVGYFGNRQWTFRHRGRIAPTLARYGIAHLGGYILNLAILYVFVDRLAFPHQIVQAIAIFVVAGLLFTAFKMFVFSCTTEVPSGLGRDAG